MALPSLGNILLVLRHLGNSQEICLISVSNTTSLWPLINSLIYLKWLLSILLFCWLYLCVLLWMPVTKFYRLWLIVLYMGVVSLKGFIEVVEALLYLVPALETSSCHFALCHCRVVFFVCFFNHSCWKLSFWYFFFHKGVQLVFVRFVIILLGFLSHPMRSCFSQDLSWYKCWY